MSAPLLSVRGVQAGYGHVVALKGVDIDVNPGEIVTLIGATGAGKSTTMMTIFGAPRARRGTSCRCRVRRHSVRCGGGDRTHLVQLDQHGVRDRRGEHCRCLLRAGHHGAHDLVADAEGVVGQLQQVGWRDHRCAGRMDLDLDAAAARIAEHHGRVRDVNDLLRAPQARPRDALCARCGAARGRTHTVRCAQQAVPRARARALEAHVGGVERRRERRRVMFERRPLPQARPRGVTMSCCIDFSDELSSCRYES